MYLWKIQQATRITRGIASRDAIFKAEYSIDTPIDRDGDSKLTLSDTLEDESAESAFVDIEHEYFAQQLRKVFDSLSSEELTELQAVVIESIFFEGLTVEQTAAKIGITKDQCAFVKDRALRMLRLPRNIKRLQPFIKL